MRKPEQKAKVQRENTRAGWKCWEKRVTPHQQIVQQPPSYMNLEYRLDNGVKEAGERMDNVITGLGGFLHPLK